MRGKTIEKGQPSLQWPPGRFQGKCLLQYLILPDHFPFRQINAPFSSEHRRDCGGHGRRNRDRDRDLGGDRDERCCYHRFGGDRDERRCYHRFGGDRDERCCYHRFGGDNSDRGRTRIDDRGCQVHDVGCQVDAVIRINRRFVRVPRDRRRSENDRGGKRRAENECMVDGLLDRISYFEMFNVLSLRTTVLSCYPDITIVRIFRFVKCILKLFSVFFERKDLKLGKQV